MPVDLARYLPVGSQSLVVLEAFLRLVEREMVSRKLVKPYADTLMFCARHGASVFTASDHNVKRTFLYPLGKNYVWGFSAYGTIYRYLISGEDLKHIDRLQHSEEYRRAAGKWLHKILRNYGATLGGIRLLIVLSRQGEDFVLTKVNPYSFNAAVNITRHAMRYMQQNGVPNALRLAPRVLPGTGLKATPENIRKFTMPSPDTAPRVDIEEENVDIAQVARELRRLFYSLP